MQETSLKAMERSEKPNKVRKAGFTPGVLNSPGTTSISVKFESAALNRVISKHGSKAKIWVDLGNEKKFGFIKEIQKHPVEGKIIHVVIQMVSQDQEVKMQLPITFHGNGELEHKLLQIHVCKAEVELVGKVALMPSAVVVDVSEKESGDNITAVDFRLPPEIMIHDAENEIYAVIKAMKEEKVQEPEEAEPAE